MMELSSYSNLINKFGGNEQLLSQFQDRHSSRIGNNQELNGYDVVGFDSGVSDSSLSILDDIDTLQDVDMLQDIDMQKNSEGMLVDLVKTLTNSLSGVIDLIQGALLGSASDAGAVLSNGSSNSLQGREHSGPTQGFFGALGSIAGSMVDKVFNQIPLLGGRGF